MNFIYNARMDERLLHSQSADSYQTSGNLLLDSFPLEAQKKLFPYFQKVFISAEEFLHQPDETVENIYFPLTGIVTEFAMLESGDSVQTTLIGRETMTALSPFLSGNPTSHFTQTLIGGEFLQIDGGKLRNVISTDPVIGQILLNHLDQYINQLSTALLCYSHHLVEARFCRWLLTLAEKADRSSQQFAVTHQQIAVLLGVNRPRISGIAKNLQNQKIISYCRGKLTITDFQELQKRICAY